MRGGGTPENRIERLVKNHYTCPGKNLSSELIDEIKGSWGKADEIDLVQEKYQKYLESVYRADDFEESFYQKLAVDAFSMNFYVLSCLRKDVTLKVENVEIVCDISSDREGKSTYSFTVELEAEKDGETVQTSDTGQAITQDGKIIWFRTHGKFIQDLPW